MADPRHAPFMPPGLPAAIAASVLLVGCFVAGVNGLRAIAAPRHQPEAKADPAPRPDAGTPRPAGPGPESPPDARPVSAEEPSPLPEPPPGALPPEVQEKVNAAIKKGVDYLKGHQNGDGSWGSSHPAALAALPAFTLLECGVPADDERIQKAAKKVRDAIDDFNAGQHTYTASLMLLFLDRLGDPADGKHIRTLALRLVAGQNGDGGWTYTIPKLSENNEDKLMEALAKTRPAGLDKIISRPSRPGGLGGIITGGAAGGGLPGLTGGRPATEEEARKAIDALPDELRDLPAFRDELAKPVPPRPKAKAKGGRPVVRARGTSDNSNTQFAALALWASLRHGIPMERALQRLGERFRKSQRADGSWGYHSAPNSWASEAMTGVGLLGLAISTGLTAEKGKPARDPDIDRGLKALAAHVRPKQPHNLYFWWTVERVAMLYGLKELEEKDWYGHAVELLLSQQRGEGFWGMGGYPGANSTVDTCFALLILKRVNLAPELTQALEGRLITGK